MARPLRIAFPGAIYHVMARRLEDQLLFNDQSDYQYFISRLEMMVELFALELYAYCLMPNHYHLFKCTPGANISEALQWLNTSYTAWFNKKHEHRGHLFQGRFVAKLVEDDNYFGEVSRYIHLNPMKAGRAVHPEDWEWSSYPGYWRKSRQKKFVMYDKILRLYGDNPISQHKRYCAYVEAGINATDIDPWRSAWHGIVLGSETFIEKIRTMIESVPPTRERDLQLVRRVKRRYSIDEIQQAVAQAAGMRVEDLRIARRSTGALPRRVAFYLCRRLSGATGREIAESFSLQRDSSIAYLARGIDEKNVLVRDAMRLLIRKSEV